MNNYVVIDGDRYDFKNVSKITEDSCSVCALENFCNIEDTPCSVFNPSEIVPNRYQYAFVKHQNNGKEIIKNKVMNKEEKLNLNAGDYAIRHCIIDQTYNGLEVHKMLCDAYIAGNNDTLDDEDERIRKELINHLKEGAEGYEAAGGNSDYQRWLAWFEKQGKQKSLNDVAKEVTKNKETAMSFLKSCGIMNANGELADEYKIKQDEEKQVVKLEPSKDLDKEFDKCCENYIFDDECEVYTARKFFELGFKAKGE